MDNAIARVATVRTQALSIGEGEFADRFSGPPWNGPDLGPPTERDVWYQRCDPDRPYDSYVKARAWAAR